MLNCYHPSSCSPSGHVLLLALPQRPVQGLILMSLFVCVCVCAARLTWGLRGIIGRFWILMGSGARGSKSPRRALCVLCVGTNEQAGLSKAPRLSRYMLGNDLWMYIEYLIHDLLRRQSVAYPRWPHTRKRMQTVLPPNPWASVCPQHPHGSPVHSSRQGRWRCV